MRIVVFIENIQNGGVDTFCSTLINNWPNSEDMFTVLCNASHPGKRNMESSIGRPCNFFYHRIPLSWSTSKHLLFFFPYSIRRLIQPILRILFFPFQYLLIRSVFKKYNGDELLVINGGFPGGESCRIANIVWHGMGRKKGVHNFHNFAVTPRFGFGWYENWIDSMLLKSTKLFISVSESCSESLRIRKTFKGLPHVPYIYNGINDVPLQEINFDLRKKLGIKSGYLCLMLGVYDPRKGHQFVLRAFDMVVEKIPNAHLVICGDGDKDEVFKVEKMKNKLLSSDNIHLLGFVPNGASLISQVDILLIGSQEFESFGLTAVESMIRMKPVVSTDVGGLPEVIGVDGSCGFITDRQSTTSFSKNVSLLLEDKRLRMKMGEAGRRRVLELFSADRMSAEYLAAIKSDEE